MRALVTCCTALIDWLSLQVIGVSQDPVISEIHLRWLRSRHNGRTPLRWKPCWLGAGGTIRNTSKLKSVEPVREVVVCTGGGACVGDGTSLSSKPVLVGGPESI